MSVSNIQNSLFETMALFGKAAADNSDATITIEGIIKSVVDAGLGKYEVEYYGNTIIAYSNGDVSYSVGDKIYVLVPEGNFDKKLIILGATSNADIAGYGSSEAANYTEISGNLIDVDFGTIEMSSYAGTTEVNDTPVTNYTSTNFGNIFKDYLKNYSTLVFGCKVMNKFQSTQRSGNYGISIKIPILANAAEGGGERIQTWKTITLDAGNMLGNVYGFDTWSPQSVYFTIDEQYTYDNSRKPLVSYFCYGFNTDAEKAEIKDIFIKDLTLKVVDKLTEEEKAGYSLRLRATEGEYFSNFYDSVKTITSVLKVNNKETSLSNAEIYWFKEDASVRMDSEDYNLYGGIGWKCLNKKLNTIINEDGTITYEYDIDDNSLEVKKSEVLSSLRYKCVIIINESQISSTITLKNLDSSLEFTLTSSAANDVYVKDAGYVELTAKVKYDGVTNLEAARSNIKYNWSRYDRNGNYISDVDDFFQVVQYNKIENDYFVTIVRYPVYEIEDFNTIYCSAKNYYVEQGVLREELLGTQSIRLSTSSNFTYDLVINGDDIIYKYDTNGDSPAGTAYDGPSTSKVKSITALTYSMYKADGSELSEAEYKSAKYTWKIEKNSLFTIKNFSTEDDDYYYLSGYGNSDGLVYNIANRFNVTKSNGSISLTVEFGGNVITRTAAINFIKEGMSGSNGSAYSARLVYGGNSASSSVPFGMLDSNGVGQKLKFIYNTTNNTLYSYDYESNVARPWSTSQKRIYLRVWENSVELDRSAYSVEYSLFDSKVTNPAFEIPSNAEGVILNLADAGKLAGGITILQAKVTVSRQGSVSGQSEIIYCYYPIEVVIAAAVDIIPDMQGGFAEVQYASDATNPSYNESLFSIKGLEEYFTTNWEFGGHLSLKEINENGEVQVKPSNKYDDGNSLNFVKATVSLDSSKVTELANKIADVQSKINSSNNTISAKRSDLDKLRLFGESYKHSDWESKANTLQDLFAKETAYESAITSLIDNNIANLEDYIHMSGYDAQCAELLENIANVKSNAENVLVQLKLLDGTDNHAIKNLINVANYSLFYDENFVESIGLSSASSIKMMIEDINGQIGNCGLAYEKLYSLSKTSLESDYRQLLDAISATINSLGDIYSLKSKCQAYFNKLQSSTSLKQFKNALSAIYNNVLSSFFSLGDNKLEIADAINTEINNDINNLTQAINEYQKQLSNLNNVYNLRNIASPHFTYIRPVVFYYNRYEKSNFNAWDGNKLETGDGSYIIAPQVGAGIKETDNSFTGLVMGQKNIENSHSEVGLYGYYKGQQTYSLNAQNGSAIFGKAGAGQVIIDPKSSEALLYSGSFFKEYDKEGLPKSYKESNYNGAGMIINLSKPEIRYGSGNFLLNENGELYAKNASLTGKIYSSEGKIGGWTINSNGLENGSIRLSSSEINLGGRCILKSDGSVTITYSNTESLSTVGGGLRTGDIQVNGTVNTNKVNTGELNIGGRSLGSIISSYVSSALSGYATIAYVNTAVASVSK